MSVPSLLHMLPHKSTTVTEAGNAGATHTLVWILMCCVILSVRMNIKSSFGMTQRS